LFDDLFLEIILKLNTMKKGIYLFLALLIVACTTDDNNNYDNSNDLQKEWLYTHTAIEATATSSTTLVIPFTEDIFAFTDRPNREFKYISGDEFASYWNDYDDENSFKLDPPNAVLTWLDADGGEEVEVVITDADFDGTNVIYTIENTTITANQSFEDVSLFVDANGSSNAVYVGLNNIVMASAGAVNNEQGNIGTVTYTVVNLTTLKFLIEQGDDVSKVVPSLVTDMSDLFKNNSTFNQNISTWDVSNVTNMSGMFYGAVTGSATAFNQPIGDWDVSNVTNMSGMFYGATAFNQPIGDWDVSSVTDMSAMFLSSALISDVNAFNQPIGNWNVSNVTDMSNMFSYARNFNQNISIWDVSNVNNMSNMFGAATAFNQNLSTWSVDGVTSCGGFSINAPLTEANTPNFTNCDPN
jgi:surface protein